MPLNKPELTLAEMKELMEYATPAEREAFFGLIDQFVNDEAPIFVPQPGPQLSAYESKADVIGYGGAGGSGKALIYNEKVLTPGGWKEIGKLKVGDTVVEPVTGEETTIIGVFPQGVQDIYKITVGDGKCYPHHTKNTPPRISGQDRFTAAKAKRLILWPRTRCCHRGLRYTLGESAWIPGSNCA